MADTANPSPATGHVHLQPVRLAAYREQSLELLQSFKDTSIARVNMILDYRYSSPY